MSEDRPRRTWWLDPYKPGERWPRVRIDDDTPTVRVPTEVMEVAEHERLMGALSGALREEELRRSL